MRTLLIDNYDSFTYNLFHYLAEVNGTEPEVVVNDCSKWELNHLDEFDNVVVSPGPGHPERPGDFGICDEILRTADLPILGICLGHQGLAAVHGGRVARAPEPYHGRVSTIRHTGTELFAGLPPQFEVVRYHSLAVAQLPAELELTGWTPDGVVMGLRHRERPMWGVQFHPESIGSSFGHQLLENFRRLSEQRGRRAPKPLRTTVEGVPNRDRTRQRQLRVLTRIMPTRWDDEVAYDELFRRGEHPYWLDSSSPGGPLGRFSIMGDAGGPLGRVAKADVSASTITIDSPGMIGTSDARQIVSGQFLAWLGQDLATIRTETPELPFDFALGWVGYLGYELKAECGGDQAHRSTEPDAVMVFSDRAMVLDHRTGTTYLLALAQDGEEHAANTWLNDATRRLGDIAGVQPEPACPAEPFGELRLRHDRGAYLRLIDECQEQIAAGESYEICLTNMAEADTVDPWEGYRSMRRASPAPFGALLSFGDVAVLSTSPERFLSVNQDRIAQTRPIKGTRPRGATELADRALVADLATSEKDRAENLMIVDLVRNDLGRCAEVGTVQVTGLFEVETFAKAHQLVSTVQAKLRPDCDAVDCVRAAFPPGSMTGAPKLRTMQIIDRLEAGARGVYSGAIGYFSLTGAADLSVVIRTAVVTPDRVRYGVGGAIIALSDSADEFEETAVKAAPMVCLTGARFPREARLAEPMQLASL